MTIVSYGAGVNSTAMILLLLDQKEPIETILFADTGAERPVSLEYLAYFREWLDKNHGLEIITVRHDGVGLVDYCKEAKTVPSRVARWCTDKFKTIPLTRWIKANYPDSIQAIGYDHGESHRIPAAPRAYRHQDRNVYPLVNALLDRDDCINLIAKAGLRVPEKSGCWLCPFQRLEQWAELEISHHDLFGTAVELEKIAAGRSDGLYVFGSQKWDTLEKRVARYRKKKCLMNDLWETSRPCGCAE